MSDRGFDRQRIGVAVVATAALAARLPLNHPIGAMRRWPRGGGMAAMGDRTAAFFDELGRAGHVPALEHASGTMRFELANSRTKPWLVTIAKGDMKVARANRPADCVVSADERTFDAVLDGRSNAMTAFLRGEIRAEGDVELLVLFQRLLPAEARPQ